MKNLLISFILACLLLPSYADYITPANFNNSYTKSAVEFNRNFNNNLRYSFRSNAGIMTSGGKVTSWTDQVAGLVASQGTGAKQPTLVSSCINSLPCLRFAGGQTLVSTGVTELVQPVTIALVARTTAPSTNPQCVFDGRDANRVLLEVYPANKYSIYANGSFEPEIGPADSNFKIFIITYNGASSTALINGGTDGSYIIGSVGFKGVTFGADSGEAFSQYLTGDIVEFNVYFGAMSNSDKTYLRNALNALYAVY